MSSAATTRTRRFVRVAGLAVFAAAVISSAVYLIWKVGGIGNGPCGHELGAAQQWGIAGACVVAFGTGHWLAAHRHEDRDPQLLAASTGGGGAEPAADSVPAGPFRALRRAARYLRTGLPTRPNAGRTGSLITYGVLMFVYIVGLLAIAYETVAVWKGSNIPSITDFVRCARNADVGWTIVVASTVSFLAGHWLWPVRDRDARPAR